MPWLPILENVVEGDRCERVQSVDAEGRPYWVCHTGVHRVKALDPGPCACPEIPCRHLGEVLGEVPCGCGSIDRAMSVHSCEPFGACTKNATGKPQRFNGQKIAVCLGCPSYAPAGRPAPI